MTGSSPLPPVGAEILVGDGVLLMLARGEGECTLSSDSAELAAESSFRREEQLDVLDTPKTEHEEDDEEVTEFDSVLRVIETVDFGDCSR